METSIINTPDTRPDRLHSLDGLPPTKTVRERLYRMSVILRDNRMTISLSGEDMTGILRYLSQRVSKHGLSIEECSGKTLQDAHGSTFLVTGPLERRRALARELEDEKDRELEGDQITPVKTYDLTILMPDRVGLIGGISGLIYDHKFNITAFNSFLCPDPLGPLDGPQEGSEPPRTLLDLTMHGLTDQGPERLWACIQVRLEVGRDGLPEMGRFKSRLREMLPSDGPGGRRFGKVLLNEHRLRSPLLSGESPDSPERHRLLGLLLSGDSLDPLERHRLLGLILSGDSPDFN